MQTVDAVYKGGVFKPEQAVALKEGAHVVLRVEASKRNNIPITPDSPTDTGERPAPFDLPMTAEPVSVRATQGEELLPDPPLQAEA